MQKNIDEFIDRMCSDKDGKRLNLSEIGTNEEFKSRFESFKEFIKDDLPNFNEQEVIKFYKHYNEFSKLYQWFGHHSLIKLLEFEQSLTK